MPKKAWDEPYKNNNVLSDDILIGIYRDGSLIYLPAEIGDPSRNVAVFYGSNKQKKDFLSTRIFASILGNKNVVILCSDIKDEIYNFARTNGYIIKELDFDDSQINSNHWEILNLLNDNDSVKEVHKFINRIIKANKIIPSSNQINAFNYISLVLLYTHYYSKENLKKFSYYLRNYEEFEKKVVSINETDSIRHYFDFARNANNYFKWDIPTISNALEPFFSKSTMKILNTGGMSLKEFQEEKCIYLLNPSLSYPWLSPFILSYLLDLSLDFDVYIDQEDFCIPDFNDVVKKGQQKIFLLSNNINNINLNYPGILSNFGAKISMHGCDINAAEYLSKISGINPGNNKYEGNCRPSEIVSCGQDKTMLFVLSAKKYTYKSIDLSYLNDVVEASL